MLQSDLGAEGRLFGYLGKVSPRTFCLGLCSAGKQIQVESSRHCEKETGSNGEENTEKYV